MKRKGPAARPIDPMTPLSASPNQSRIGVVSDTHGWLRPEVLRALHGVDIVIHAGDIGAQDVVQGLETIAPVRAVRGNTDCDPWTASLPASLELEVAGARILVLHDVNRLPGSLGRDRYGAIVSGHTHVAAQVERDGTLYFNPGAAGPARFGRPVSVGILEVCNGVVSGEIVVIEA